MDMIGSVRRLVSTAIQLAQEANVKTTAAFLLTDGMKKLTTMLKQILSTFQTPRSQLIRRHTLRYCALRLSKPTPTLLLTALLTLGLSLTTPPANANNSPLGSYDSCVGTCGCQPKNQSPVVSAGSVTNECGQGSGASINGNVVTAWGQTATLSADGMSLSWQDGSNWVRSMAKPKDWGPPSPDKCISNPCNAATGHKFQRETDIAILGAAMPLTRYYNSQFSRDLGWGYGWSASVLGGNLTALVTYPGRVQRLRADGKGESFSCTASACTGDADTQMQLTPDATGYTLIRRDTSSERYNLSGQLLSETDSAGRITSYGYTTGKLTSVTTSFGHTLTFTYNAGGHIDTVTDSDQKVIRYGYDTNNNLTRVDYPDLTAKIYHYENTSFPNYLTGISYVDAAGLTTRYSTYAYDTAGKAITTQHAVTDNVAPQEKFTLAYDSATQTTVTDPVNMNEVMTFSTNLGVKNLVSKVNQTDGKSVQQVFDANNNLTCRQDEEGRVTTYAHNASNQRISLTEGRTGTCAVPVTTAATRTMGYQYLSSNLDLPTVITSPSVAGGTNSKTTTIQYTDVSHPSLPTIMTQSGFTPLGSPVARNLTLGYNASGQVNSIDGPRTDVSDVTTLEYYACTTGGACGQLKKMTNALDHVTTYDSYDANGRLLQMTDPNGLVTSYTYDPRGRLATLTQTPPLGLARVTRYTYTPFDAVKTLTTPDAITLTYGYDAAQYLRTITDNLGNKVTYHYDLKGNRDNEETFDPEGTLVRTISYASDLRNRLKTINTAGSITQLITDAVGNLRSETDPNNNPNTLHTPDALSRLLQTVDRMGGLTTYDYDVNDRLTQTKVPNNATTQYSYDDLGNLLKEVSPDRGTTLYTHDSAGNVKTQTDARGILATYTYDALNRVSAIDYPGVTDDVVFQYDQSSTEVCTAGRGRLCQAVDSNASTTYAYDAYGNRTRETRLGHTLRYTFDAGNRINTITYPSGMLITYVYDAVGRIKDITRTQGTLTTPMISNRTYRADGLMKAQSFGNGLSETRNHDLQGRLQNQALGNVYSRAYPLYDPNGNVKQISTTSTPAFSGQYNYDALDRLIQDTNNIATHAFQYDGNSNRTLDNTQPYIYAPNTNRLNTLTGIALTHDAAGNITQDNLGRTYTYDGPGRLASATVNGVTTNYRYNAFGQRTQKQYQNGTTLQYYTGQNGELLAETGGNGRLAEYVYAEGIPIAQLRYAPEPSSAPIPPALTGFWPNSGSANSMVFVFGSGFIPNQTQVRINGISATVVQVIDSDLLIFLLPAGNTNGTIQITTAQGQTNSSSSFGTALNGLQVSGIWPAQGKAGIPVFIFGSGFTPTTQVSFNLTRAPMVHALDANLIVVFVPQGVTTGPVKVTTAQGSAISAIPFTVIGNILPVGTVTYLYTDHLGTPRLATDASQTVRWRWDGDAFGATPPNEDPDGDGKKTTINVAWTGTYRDKETGLFYNGANYYDPKSGRWITPDDMSVAEHFESWRARMGVPGQPPLEANPYVRTLNNPLRWVDPTGQAIAIPPPPGTSQSPPEPPSVGSYPWGPPPKHDPYSQTDWNCVLRCTAIRAATGVAASTAAKKGAEAAAGAENKTIGKIGKSASGMIKTFGPAGRVLGGLNTAGDCLEECTTTGICGIK